MKRTTAIALLATLLAASAVLLGAVPASAHDDEANLELQSDPVGDAGPLSLDLRVSVRFSSDDHLVPDATVSVTGTGPGGATLPATPMSAVPETEGLYAAELAFPVAGAWSLQVTSTEPAGELAVQVDVPDAEATTTTSAAEEPTPTTEEPEADESVEQQAEDDPDLAPILLGVAAVLVLGVVVVALVLRSRKAKASDNSH
jgi:hypothetical protein